MKSVEMIEQLESRLSTAVVGDILDEMGLYRQFLPPGLVPLDAGTIMAGTALTVLEADCYSPRDFSAGEERSFGLMFEALDALSPGDIYICTGSSDSYALWGELMSTRALRLKARGAIVDGFHRDTAGIKSLGFSLFSRGAYSRDQRVRGRVIDYNCPLEFKGGARVEPGDLLFADHEGVLAIPHEQAAEVVRRSLAKVEGENRVREALEAGMSAAEAFRKFGIM